MEIPKGHIKNTEVPWFKEMFHNPGKTGNFTFSWKQKIIYQHGLKREERGKKRPKGKKKKKKRGKKKEAFHITKIPIQPTFDFTSMEFNYIVGWRRFKISSYTNLMKNKPGWYGDENKEGWLTILSWTTEFLHAL